jgi:hypothetical protein
MTCSAPSTPSAHPIHVPLLAYGIWGRLIVAPRGSSCFSRGPGRAGGCASVCDTGSPICHCALNRTENAARTTRPNCNLPVKSSRSWQHAVGAVGWAVTCLRGGGGVHDGFLTNRRPLANILLSKIPSFMLICLAPYRESASTRYGSRRRPPVPPTWRTPWWSCPWASMTMTSTRKADLPISRS